MENITHYEAMAKLALRPEERSQVQDQAQRLVESFAALSAVDTTATEPLVSVLNLQNDLREDVSAKWQSRETLLANAPEQYGGYFQVPKTVE